MYSIGLRVITLFTLGIGLHACHEPYNDTHRDTNFVNAGEYHYIDYSFEPYETYRIELITYSGDADVAVYNEYDELLVFSEEYSTRTDAVIFTAGDINYQIEVYGNRNSEYDLFIDRLPYYDTGLNTSVDGIEFIIDRNSFTGDTYSILATKSFKVSHDYDLLTITPWPDPIWLDVTPTGTVYDVPERDGTTVSVNILETPSAATTNYASVAVQAQDYEGKIDVFKVVDVVYRVVD